MHVVAVASRKGGSGKTTLAGHLAVAAERAGVKPALVIDTDPQGNLSQWWNARQSQTPLFARATSERLSAGIARIRELNVALLVIDTPPAIDATITDVIRIADLVVIPVRPSPHDLRAAGATVELAEHLGKPFIFALNAATARTRISNDAVIALSQHGTVAPVILHHRTGFAASMIDGRTVMEVPGDERAAQEVEQLWAYIDNRLNHNYRTILPALPAVEEATEDNTWAA